MQGVISSNSDKSHLNFIENFTENFKYIFPEGSLFFGLRVRISYSGLGPGSQYTTQGSLQ